MHNAKHQYLPLILSLTLLAACSGTPPSDGLTSTGSRAEVFEPGVPGGITQETERISAVVRAIDPVKRTFVLEDEQGNRQTFHAIPEMRNFPQLAVGDRVNAVVTQERVVQLREPGQPAGNGAAGMVAGAPEGAKPGVLMADTVELSAKVKVIDTLNHTATLEFADGSRRVVRVRPDIELRNEYLNQEVVIRVTTAMAIRVEKP
ncbi:hypothetical protein ACUTAH_03025 [Metapseudomonas furukawaii]|uniref:hypothetical protein n=1 Tax=Metapseudomonas furukawaii TaxID=1149133 RepID=UPI004045FFD1